MNEPERLLLQAIGKGMLALIRSSVEEEAAHPTKAEVADIHADIKACLELAGLGTVAPMMKPHDIVGRWGELERAARDCKARHGVEKTRAVISRSSGKAKLKEVEFHQYPALIEALREAVKFPSSDNG